MKQIYLLSAFLMITLLTFAGTSSPTDAENIKLKGNSQTSMGDYAINELQPAVIDGEELRQFELTYQNAKHPVVILICQKNNCRDYIVRSKNMEIKYVCKKSGFGAQPVTGKFITYDPAINSYFVSAEELAHQTRICDGNLSVEDALGLIASYYPALIKNKDLL